MKPTSKEIAKCKHPNSRKTIALAKKSGRMRSKEEQKLGKYIKQNIVGEKIAWFRDNLPNIECEVLTKSQVAELIVKYLSRFEEELEQIKIKNSIGGKRNKQHASRESAIEMTKERELGEYRTCGIEIPDLLNKEQLNTLKMWNGELRFLPNFKLKRFSINDL